MADVPVCLRCRSRHVNLQTLQDGFVPGSAEQWVCKECGHIGMPLLMDERDAPSAADPVYDQPPAGAVDWREGPSPRALRGR